MILDKLAGNLFRIKNTFGSNIYLISENGLVMVDAGFPFDLAMLHLGLRELGSGPARIDLILATHYHGDHIGTIAGLRRRYGVRAAMHEADIPYAMGEVPQEKCEAKALTLLFYTALWPFFSYRHFHVDWSLKGGEVIDCLGGLEVIHTPGHSVGCICLYSESEGILFSGDLVRNERGVLEGPPEHFTTDAATTAQSLKKVASLDFDTLLPGHGQVILGGAGDRFRSFLEEGMIWPLTPSG